MLKLLEAIQNDIIGTATLSDIFRKASVLGYRLKNEEFKSWVNFELDGYRAKDVEIPPYRKIAVPSLANYSNGFRFYENQLIARDVIPSELYELLGFVRLSQSIREIEALVEGMNRDHSKSLQMHWPQAAVNLLSAKLSDDYECSAAWKVISREHLIRVLDSIKNKLLAFTLELAELYPEAAQVDFGNPSENPTPEQVTQIFQFTIYGEGHTIQTGNNPQYKREEHTMNEVNIGDGNTFQGDFVVANAIEQSFNRVAQSDIPADQKELLRQLTLAAAAMSKELTPEAAQQVVTDVEVLTKEATSSTPRKQWIRLSGEGLIKAAATVGAIGGPVITVVQKLLPLLEGK